MMNLLLFTCLAYLSISGAAFQASQPCQDRSTPALPTQDAAGEVAEAARLGVNVVKLYEEGKYEEALPLAKRALEIRERNLTPGDERIATAVMNIAEIYLAMKKLSEAQQFLERALQEYEKKLGPEDRRLSTILDRLGQVHFSRSHFPETVDAWNRSLRIKEKAFGADSREVAELLHKLAEFYRFRRKYKEAEPLYDRALMIMRTKVALDEDATENLLEHYACVYYETGKSGKLESLKQKYLPEKPPDTSGSWVLDGKALTLPKPEYSSAARSAHASGTVIVAVTIDETGKVIEARDMCGGHPALTEASIDSARRARFSPTKLSGQPVKVKGIITYRFLVQ